MSAAPDNGRLRLDKWLWHARFFKSRSLASRACLASRVRINRGVVSKSHATVKPGDVVTFPQGAAIRVIEVVALSARRGPAAEARALYDDLAPPPERAQRAAPPGANAGARTHGTGRPTKSDRRAIMRLTDRDS